MKKAITLLDGSVGQELVKQYGKKPTPLWSTEVMLRDPNICLLYTSDAADDLSV